MPLCVQFVISLQHKAELPASCVVRPAMLSSALDSFCCNVFAGTCKAVAWLNKAAVQLRQCYHSIVMPCE